MREILVKDPFMKQCCVCGKTPQWHHHIIFGGKALNEAWNIVPLCPFHHAQVNVRELYQLIEWVVLNRATDDELDDYSRIMNYKQKRVWLNRKYGTFAAKDIAKHYAHIDFQNTSRRS